MFVNRDMWVRSGFHGAKSGLNVGYELKGTGVASIGVGGFPQAVFADIRGLDTASFLSTMAGFPVSDRALMPLPWH